MSRPTKKISQTILPISLVNRFPFMRFDITVFIAIASVSAQSPAPVVRGVGLNLTHGQTFDDTTRGYSQPNATLFVSGAATQPVGEPATNYRLPLNGYSVTLTEDPGVPGR
ncbi:MAG: hypothetical protein FJW36_01320 [Acidobacteria bacterium]|nr:hypothetical protein [Acidobacteriota bacterium]